MIHKQLLDMHAPFARDLAIAGDYDFFLRAVDDTVAHNISEVTCFFGDAGVSSNVLAALRETRKAQARSQHVGPLRAYMYYSLRVLAMPAGSVYRRIKRMATSKP